jgi:uncharacterized membrane protein YedE/YeeE
LAGLGVGVVFILDVPVQQRSTVIPVLFTIGGILAGAALTLLFAPSDFLEGPVGRRWLKLVGTSNLLVARLICLLFAALLLGIGAYLLIPILKF